ncbi:hypothetical protein BBJ28_00003303 [Nothophytophthora sp. Chile5]|nr:hypothetical protein BBJ28_00003303 [Nothophytophthora sp. Chile5]
MQRLERTLSSASALGDDVNSALMDVDSAPCSLVSRGSECYDLDLDEEEALRKAARAGILLLEANRELQEEAAALREQVAVLESERPQMRAELTARADELASLKEDRKRCLVENNALCNELKAKSALVTDLLEREDRLQQQATDAEASKQLAEYQLDVFRAEQAEQQRLEAAKAEAADKQRYAVANPAATYDSNQASAFTFTDYEELQHRLQSTADESEGRALEIKSLRKEGDALRRKAVKLTECVAHIERLERRNEKLQSANETLREERMEERAVLDSLRSMNLVYKKIAESRPFAADCTCAQHPEEADPTALGVTVRDVLIEANMKLEAELRELRTALNLPGISAQDAGEEALEQALKRVGSNSSNGSEASDTASSSGGDTLAEIAQEKLIRKVQGLTEKLSLSRDMLRHTKVQWCAAVASQKALEECNESSQEEITRLTHQLDSYIAALASFEEDAGAPERKRRDLLHSEDSSKWTEETAPYPAPPGDLNSPLIKCLLDHWTTDKSKVMQLSDWLHNSIRGTGRATPLRLVDLSSEVAAGFAQLLVPIMRERHGVSVSIYRRDSVHILSDLVLQTNQPSVVMQSYVTESTAATHGDRDVLTRLRDPEQTGEPELDADGRASTGDSHLLRGEAGFLYGAEPSERSHLQANGFPFWKTPMTTAQAFVLL